MSRDAGAPEGTRSVLDGRYRLGEVLAHGGMSTVHRGTDLRLARPVAIKVMDPALADDPAFVRRFEREARAAARLSHPGIVAVHDQGRDDAGAIFLVLELVEGGTLRDVLHEQVRLAPSTALTVVEQVLTALLVAHRAGMVHRDVKPENVLVTRTGELKVADFGLVAAAWDGAADGSLDTGGSTADDVVMGTAAYLAPEQVEHGRADARSDVYAAGIVLFELLTGVPPHGGDSAFATAYRHVTTDVPAPSTRAPGIPRALDRLVLAATRRDPAERLAGAEAFLAAAATARREEGLEHSPVPPPATRRSTASSPPPPRRGTRRFTGPVPPPRRGTDGPSGRWSTPGPAPRRGPGTARRRPDDGAASRPPGAAASSASSPSAAPAAEDLDLTPEEPPVRDRDVVDRVERHARRAERVRSRRVFTAWVVAVGALTVVAGVAGWGLGLPV